jgi:hypothetical protein
MQASGLEDEFHRGLVSYGSNEFRRHQPNIYLLKASSSILVARHTPYFATRNTSLICETPQETHAFGDLEEVDGAAALGSKKSPALRAGLFAFIGTLHRAAMELPGTPE